MGAAQDETEEVNVAVFCETLFAKSIWAEFSPQTTAPGIALPNANRSPGHFDKLKRQQVALCV